MKQVYIYKLLHPLTKEVRYVGKTTNTNRRLSSHISEAKLNKSKRYVLNWINSLLKQDLKPLLEIIEVCDKNIWQKREQYWIKYYRDLNSNLCNICDGGLGGTGSKNFSIQEINRRKKQMSNSFSLFDHLTKLKIWGLIQRGFTWQDIRNIYPNFTRSIYYQVSSGRVWRDVTLLIKPEKCKKIHPRSRFSVEDILDIRMLDIHLSQKEISLMFQCNPAIIQRVVNRISYADIP